MLLVALALVSACSVRTLPADATGEQVFNSICARCHGADLAGGIGPALGQGSKAAQMTDGFYRTTIRYGMGRMPSYGSTLTDQQVERVIEYVRQRQGNG